MNPRRIHERMQANFPAFDIAALSWTNLLDASGQLVDVAVENVVLAPFCGKGIGEVIVEVHRKLGAIVPLSSLADYIQSHAGKGVVRVADQAFTTFAVIAISGVGASWTLDAPQQMAFERDT